MRRVVLLSLIIYGLIIVGLITRDGRLLTLAIPAIIFLVTGLIFEPETPDLTIKRSLSKDRSTPDELITVTLSITNNGPGIEELLIQDVLPQSLTLVDGSPGILTDLRAGQTTELEYNVQGKRGLYRFASVWVTARERLGLFEKRISIEAPGQFFILPEIAKIKQVAIRPRRIGVYNGLIPARQGGSGVEFFGIREYQPGDPLRWINARASARYHQKLFINEFQQERMADVGLILDARLQSDARYGQDSLFEYCVQAAASMAETFLEGGNRVGLLIYGRSIDWTFPGYGKVQQERLMRVFARAKQGDGKIFEKLDFMPTRLFPTRSQLIFISPLLLEDADTLIKLRARGYQLLVISPNPVSFERMGLIDSPAVALATRVAGVERELLLRKLRQAEIQVVDWSIETPFYQIAHIALSYLPFQRGQTLV